MKMKMNMKTVAIPVTIAALTLAGLMVVLRMTGLTSDAFTSVGLIAVIVVATGIGIARAVSTRRSHEGRS